VLKEILEELEVLELKGDTNPKAKKHAKIVAKARAKVKCSGNKTPSKVKDTGTQVKFRCTPKDKKKARKMVKVRKKFNKTAKGKKAVKVTQLTKKYRK
jgi:hypothetical protein